MVWPRRTVCLLIFGFTVLSTWSLFPYLSFKYRDYKRVPIYILSKNFHGHGHNMTLTQHENVLQPEKCSVSRNVLSSYNKYIQMKNVKDFMMTADPTFSRVNVHWNAFTGIRLGDDIRVTVTLHNSYGKRLQTGGDIIRIWMTEPSLKAGTAGYVVDHQNGTYTGYLKALWSGYPQVKVSIATKKEQVAFVMQYIEDIGLLHNIYGKYEHDNVSEVARCSTIPKIPGYGDVCNLTAQNYDMDWFCGKPSTLSELKCSHWKYSNSTKVTELGRLVKINHLNDKHLLISLVKIKVIGGQGSVKTNNMSCSIRSTLDTWNDVNPVGFYYNDIWRLLKCRNTFRRIYSNIVKCLSNHHFVFAGDSNLRSWFHVLRKRLNMEITTTGYITTKAWHDVLRAKRKDINTTLVWTPHEIPFYNGAFALLKAMKAVSRQLDDISQPSNISVVVFIHLYFHLVKISPKQFRIHVRNAKYGVHRLLRRIPKARIFIKGPHAMTSENIVEPIDYMRKFQEEIWLEEFKELQDRVVYLDQWEMSVIKENINYHPAQKIVADGMNVFFSYYCKNDYK